MLVPETVTKPKFGVVNGKIVPVETVQVQQFVKYNMSDFTEEGLRSLIQAGHEDYFDDSEKDQLEELGILVEKISPNLTFSNVSATRNEGAFYFQNGHCSCHVKEAPIIVEVSRLGNGIISASTDVEGNSNYFKSNCGINVDGTTVKINTFKESFNDGSSNVVRISVAETSNYLSEYKDITVSFFTGPF